MEDAGAPLFTFDGVGNRTSLVQSLVGRRSIEDPKHEAHESAKHEQEEAKHDAALTKTTSYATNSTNEYVAVGGLVQSHDPNGNLRDDGKFVYTYDFRNLLIERKRSGGRLPLRHRLSSLTA